MRKIMGAAVIAAALSFVGRMLLVPASAAPPVATVSPGYDARLAESKPTDVSARRRYYRRYGYGPRYYRPYYAPRYYYRPRPYYYRPYGYGYSPYGYGYRPYGYGYRPYGFGPRFGFGFGW